MKRIILAVALIAVACSQNPGKTEGQMKARVIQPLFAMDEAGLDASYEWTLRELRDCDPSLDIVVLPEFSEVPGKTSNEGFLETVHKYGPKLLETCEETARRCSTLVFCGAIDTSCEKPRNAVFVYGRDGSLLGKYYKEHLTAGEWQKYGLDKSYTEQWNEPYLLDIEGVRYMFLICYDFYFYENYSNIARWKPDVIIGASHQRSDPHHVLDIIDQFCAYNTGAYLVRASVSMGKKSKIGGCSCVVGPDGKILGNLYSKVKHLDVTFDPKAKYLKPAGYGNPPAMHSEYIEIGRRPWKYRPGGSAIVPPLSEQPEERSTVYSNDLATLGAAVATGVQEIAFDLDASSDWESVLRPIMAKLACHAIMNIRLKGDWTPEARARLDEIIFAYDAGGYVYF
jgi:predicted amidohydrolase